MRCQQSPRLHSGTSSRIRLIASRFLAGPCLIPAISNRSMAANCLLGLLPFCSGAWDIAANSLHGGPESSACSVQQAEIHRSRGLLTINPERSSCSHQRGAAFVVAYFFPWTKEPLSLSLTACPRRRRVWTSQHAIARLVRGRLAGALLSGDARFVDSYPTSIEGTSGRKKYHKKI